MKIIDAIWEKRNLGVDTVEIEVESGDSLEEIEENIEKVTATYSVIKINLGNVRAMAIAQKYGYSYMETLYALEGKVKVIKSPRAYERFASVLTTEIADEEMTEAVLEEVKSGKIFETDRIALDPYFGAEVAGRRYALWIRDELSRGAYIYIVKYKDKPVTFTVMKRKTETEFHSLLGGVLGEAGKGLGFTGIQAITDVVKEANGLKIITHVSSNNLPMLRLHMNFGYDILSGTNVFVKHNG